MFVGIIFTSLFPGVQTLGTERIYHECDFLEALRLGGGDFSMFLMWTPVASQNFEILHEVLIKYK